MATQTAPPKAQEGGDPGQQRLAQLEAVEQQMVLAAFAELKKRDAGELRIAIRLNRQTGIKEIVYCGVHEQQSLDRLRKLYQQMSGRNNGGRAITF